MRVVLLGVLFTLAGCTDAVMLRNQATGQTAQCGPYWAGLSEFRGPANAARESRCIDDYQRQGFERAP